MNKKLLFGVILGTMLLGLVIASAIYYHTIPVTSTIGEALSSTTVALNFSGFPGETIIQNIDVNNVANVPLNTELTWTEGNNLNLVNYTNDLPKTINLVPGANVVPVSFTYATDSTIGDFDGNITLTRTN